MCPSNVCVVILILKRVCFGPNRIHDKWHSFEWVETTQASCNVWGQGRNNEFGEFFTIGVHDPRQRRIVIYKVCVSTIKAGADWLGF